MWTALLVFLSGTGADAQNAPEIYEPPAPGRFGSALTISDADYGDGDAAPLGVALFGIRLIGPDEAVSPKPDRGISVGAVPYVPEAVLEAALDPFLGQALSLALIAEIQSAVAKVWRGTGYPFVSVTAPPQEITSGVLQLRLIEARMGQVTAEGSVIGDGDRLAASVRTASGQRIAAAAIDEDVRWMNRRGLRRVEAVFAAGNADGESDLVLKVTDEKRFGAYAGWSNSGSAATGVDRYFVGMSAWIPELNDATLSYQLTAGSDLLREPHRITLKPGAFPAYVGHAGRLVLPTAARQEIQFAPAFVATRETPDALIAIESTTLELPVSYRMAVSDVVPGFHFGDVYAGFQVKQLRRRTYFGGIEVADGRAGLFQLTAGWAHAMSDRHGRSAVDLSVTVNPGGVVAGNTAAAWSAFSGGRVTDVTYAYATLDLFRQTDLPAGFALNNALLARVAATPLPDTERLTLGGETAVRGYSLDDGAVDAGLVLRNELRLPALQVTAAAGIADALSSFLLLDVGYGVDMAKRTSVALVAAGAGFDYALGGHVSASVSGAVALTRGLVTRPGDVAVHARVTAAF